MNLYISLGDEIDKEKFFKRMDSLEEHLTILEKTVSTLNGKKHVRNLKDSAAGLSNAGKELIKIYDSSPENFEAKDNEDLIKAIRNLVFIIRNEGVALAQNKIVDEAIEASSNVKQAEGYLLFLYLNLDDPEYRTNYFKAVETLKGNLFVLEEEVLESEGREILQLMKSHMKVIENTGEELIEIHDSDPEAYNPKDNEDKILEFHEASSTIRKKGIEIAKQELSYSAGEGISSEDSERIKFIKILVIAITAIVVLLVIAIGFLCIKPKK
jgi:ferritin-like metal-binding protein YciE